MFRLSCWSWPGWVWQASNVFSGSRGEDVTQDTLDVLDDFLFSLDIQTQPKTSMPGTANAPVGAA